MDQEERLVAELQMLGIRYLSRKESFQVQRVRPAHQLLADLIRQPSSRVRMAVVPLLLAKPDFAQAIPAVMQSLAGDDALLMKILYTAAVYLQQIYQTQHIQSLPQRDQLLPDLFASELGISNELDERECLKVLATIHQAFSSLSLNWAGTYENAVQKWLHQIALEAKWKQSQPVT
jgi:hypothetical protein